MALTDLERIRSLIGDMHKSAVNEEVGLGDSATTLFQLDMFPVRTGTLTVFVSGTAKPSASANVLLGRFDLTGSAPAAGDRILATYQYNALSDDEIQSCLDLASAAGSLLAASYAARALAGNYGRFFAYTQGDRSINKDKMAEKFISLAESLESAYENNLDLAGITMRYITFDDSGTEFDNYDTAVAAKLSTGTFGDTL